MGFPNWLLCPHAVVKPYVQTTSGSQRRTDRRVRPPYYMSASDVIFIQERNALNSVNIPLAFLFHKIVVGPNTGNIGELLKNTGNPTFNPNHKADIIRALKMAWQLSTWGKGEMNYTYALENMSIDKVGKQYAEVYRDLNSRL